MKLMELELNTLLLCAAILLVLFMTFQNVRLDQQNGQLSVSLDALRQEYAMLEAASRLLGTKVSDDVAVELINDELAERNLLVVYNSEVCSRLTNNELAKNACNESLNSELEAVKEHFQTDGTTGIKLQVLVGVDKLSDTEQALALNQDGQASFKYVDVPGEVLGRAFPLVDNSYVSAGPLYLLTDSDLRIRSVFKRRRGTDLSPLKHWLDQLSD